MQESSERTDADHLRVQADDLEARGRLLDAIDRLTEANRSCRDAEIERRLVRLRHEAFATLDREPQPRPLDASADNRLTDHRLTGDAGSHGPPVVSPSELSSDVMRAAILSRGCLHVRGLFPEPLVDALVDNIDQAFAAYDARTPGKPAPAGGQRYVPFVDAASSQDEQRRIWVQRKWVRDAEGLWVVDFPGALFEMIEAFEAVGLAHHIREFLGERPTLSLNKCTLRRVPPDLQMNSNWHQDGAFLGTGDLRTINVWLPLSHCGVDAPGLDFIPRRLDLLEPGSGGSLFHWDLGPGILEGQLEDVPIARPEFEPGDVLLFDELLLHRTALDPAMTKNRYAIESWFFAPSTYPERQIPIVF